MQAKYNTIGNNYNVTRKADPFLADMLYSLLQPKPNGLYLDIGCGTGNYTNALHKKGVDFIGIDPSTKMLNEAKKKNATIDFRIGTAENTGLDDHQVDGCMGTLTIHHWTDLTEGFSELYRVIKPNGNIVIFTSTPQQMQGYWLNHYFPKMLKDSMVQMPSSEAVIEAMTAAKFKNITTAPYSIKPDLEDLFLYSGKHNPSLYFNPSVRQGISSFSALANKQEVDKGLKHLEADIASGKVNQIIETYNNDNGDYLYISAVK